MMEKVILVFGCFILAIMLLCVLSAMNRTHKLIKEEKERPRITGGGFEMP